MSMSTTDLDLREILQRGLVRCVYQPIVHLETGEVVGYEALARGPQGTDLERPDQLFGAARSQGLLAELDWACRTAALRGALEAGMDKRTLLFINVEPDVPSSEAPEDHVPVWTAAAERLRVVFEITERAATSRAAELVTNIHRLREIGWGAALDDVGVDPRSLAMLPFIAADVVKLDMSLVQGRTTLEIARTVHAVEAESERSGTLVVAEGIETHVEYATAIALGATLGQGWLFGKPGPLPALIPAPNVQVELPQLDVPPVEKTPFALIEPARPTKTGTKAILLTMSRQLEEQALSLGDTPVVLATFQEAERFSPATARRYEQLASRVALVGALGVGMSPEPVPGVRGATMSPDDPLRGEWVVAVVGAHFAAAFAAADLGDSGPDMERRFTYAVTHDRDLVLHMARSLMSRLDHDH